MDMFFNLSLYPVNAVAYTHAANQARKYRSESQLEDDFLPIPPTGSARTATAKMADRRIYYRPQRRFAPVARSFADTVDEVVHRSYPLSYMSTLAKR